MSQEFGYPKFDAEGVKVLTGLDGPCANMLQNVTVYRLKPGQSRSFQLDDQEMAAVLVEGSVVFEWNGRREQAARENFFKDGAYCLHVPRGLGVAITASEPSEILLQSTKNDKNFEPQFYTPENCLEETFGQGLFEGKAQRSVRTFFDYHSAPYSNMVCGEILVPQGGWSSYPPHHHPQPEIYYYRFAKGQGFGACFSGDNVYKITDGSFSALPGGQCHPQVNAPGYPMYYIWMIRHFDGSPWTERTFDPAHQWLLDK